MDDVGELQDLDGHFGLDLRFQFRVLGAEAAAFGRDWSEPHVLEDFRHKLLDPFFVVHASNHSHANLRVLRELRLLDTNVPVGEGNEGFLIISKREMDERIEGFVE